MLNKSVLIYLLQMKHTIIKWLNKLRGQRLVTINRFFHTFFGLSKTELRATEVYCRDTRAYNYVEIERY